MKTRTLIKNELERLKVDLDRDAELRLFFEHFTGKDYFLASLADDDIADDVAEKISNAVTERLSGAPCQYITGEQYFMGNRFTVSPTVLIPRSDTEIIAEEVIKYVLVNKKSLKVLDLCTGSGCIGINIARAASNCTVDCSDISHDALSVAKENAALNGVEGKVSFILSDMLDNCGTYDVIVSNPPYIPTNVIETLDVKVKKHEPFSALDGGKDGLDFYRIIAENADKHLVSGGRIFLEIGYDQKESVTAIFKEKGYTGITSKKDYSGNDRMIVCSKK